MGSGESFCLSVFVYITRWWKLFKREGKVDNVKDIQVCIFHRNNVLKCDRSLSNEGRTIYTFVFNIIILSVILHYINIYIIFQVK